MGGGGTILRTTDGGANWIIQPSGTFKTLYGVSFSDANNGTVAGFEFGGTGIILHTADGGASWTEQSAPTLSHFYAVSVEDSNSGVVVGNSGTILRTSDGGTNWAFAQPSATFQFLYGVSFTDANTGTAVGYDYPSGTILRTTDGGQTWVRQESGLSNTFSGINFFSVDFSSETTGTVVGESGIILRTTDGGQTWVEQTSGTIDYLYKVFLPTTITEPRSGSFSARSFTRATVAKLGQPKSSGTIEGFFGISFTDANTGTVVGSFGTILHTTDGGQTWIPQTSGTTDQLRAVSFADANNGTIVGESGLILRTAMVDRPGSVKRAERPRLSSRLR